MPSLAILELSEKIETMPFNLKRKERKNKTPKVKNWASSMSDTAKYRQMMKGI